MHANCPGYCDDVDLKTDLYSHFLHNIVQERAAACTSPKANEWEVSACHTLFREMNFNAQWKRFGIVIGSIGLSDSKNWHWDLASWYLGSACTQICLFLMSSNSWSTDAFHATMLIVLREWFLTRFRIGEEAVKAASASFLGVLMGSTDETYVYFYVAASNAAATAFLLYLRAACRYWQTRGTTCCRCAHVSSRKRCSECRS
jgi:hypothetical protein